MSAPVEGPEPSKDATAMHHTVEMRSSFALSLSSSLGYEGFGSFHSKHVDSLAGTESVRPCAPNSIQLAIEQMRAREAMPLGRDMRSEVCVSAQWTFLNHGAFGAPMRAMCDIAHMWREYTEEQPLRFIDREVRLPPVLH